MTEEEENRIIKLCYSQLDKFTELYPESGSENSMPKNVKLTVYCENYGEDGFVVNETLKELGINAFIVKKWIIHSELEKLIGEKLL